MNEVSAYITDQTPECAKICRKLTKEIKATLPKATARLYHGSPVWFVGENAVGGFSVSAKKEVVLLFWNGQSFDEPQLKSVGKFKAAQIRFKAPADINPIDLRRWLKKAGKDVWDLTSLRKKAR